MTPILPINILHINAISDLRRGAPVIFKAILVMPLW